MSIRFRLLIYFGLLSGAGAITFVVLWLYGVPQIGIEGIQTAEYRRSIATVESLADKERDVFANWFVERRRELQLLARSELFSTAVRESTGQRGARQGRAHAMLERQLKMVKESNAGVYNYIYLVNPVNGDLLASTQSDLKSPPNAHLEILLESAQPGLAEFVYLLGSADSQQVLITHQVLGVDRDGMPNGELYGVLLASVDLSAPMRGEEVTVRQYLGPTGALRLVDRNGNVLASNEPIGSVNSQSAAEDHLKAAVEPGSEGVKVLQTASGREVLMAFRHLNLGASDGLSLLATRGLDEALAGSRANFTRLVSVGALVFLLAMGLVLFAAKRISNTEDQIRVLNASLEMRVEQRTRELEQVNGNLTQTLSRLERTQDELVESAKLASLGSLVAGVAHELNTPIGNALMAASTLSDEAHHFEELSKGGITRSAFEQHLANTLTGTSMMMSNISRAAELISGFKQLAMDQSSDQRRSFNLGDALDEMKNAMGPTLRKLPYDLVISKGSDDIVMDSFPGALTRSLINLINNAIVHGFEGRKAGTIKIECHRTDPDHVEIVFSDDGVGMTEAVRNHVFDPFFTTKLGQGGSGLGMHIVYNNITKMLGGRIELFSEPGQGSQYHLYLPLQAT